MYTSSCQTHGCMELLATIVLQVMHVKILSGLPCCFVNSSCNHVPLCPTCIQNFNEYVYPVYLYPIYIQVVMINTDYSLKITPFT